VLSGETCVRTVGPTRALDGIEPQPVLGEAKAEYDCSITALISVAIPWPVTASAKQLPKCLVIFCIWPFVIHVINLARVNGGGKNDILKVRKCLDMF